MINEAKNYQETAALRLQVITPLNIGDGSTLLPNDYLYDAKTQTVYFVNHRLWHKFIADNNLLVQYENYLASGNKTKNMLAWLKQQGYGLADVKDAVCGSAKAEVNVMQPDSKNSVNEIHSQIKLADGKAYLPGSSLKGVFRTAIIYHLLQQNKTLKQKYWQQVYNAWREYNTSYRENSDRKKFKTNLSKVAANIEASLNTLNVYSDKPSNAVNSVLRGLLVSDATSEKIAATVILQKCDLVYSGKENNISVFRECVAPNTIFSFTVKLEKKMTAVIGLNSVVTLLQWLQDYFDFVIGVQKKAFGKFYGHAFAETETANIFLGSNTGFLSKTLLMALAPEGEEKLAVQVIKQLLDINFRSHKHMSLDKSISPRTLKATTYAGQQMLMGLARVTIK